MSDTKQEWDKRIGIPDEITTDKDKKQKTALQKVIDKLNFELSKDDGDKWYGGLIHAIKECEAHLPEERQQIIDARESHPKQMKRLGWNVNANDGEEYFNETFESNL